MRNLLASKRLNKWDRKQAIRRSKNWGSSPWNASQLLTIDLDADGDRDVVAVNYAFDSSAPNFVWRNDGDYRFELTQIVNPRSEWSSESVSGDFDNDGDLDVLIGADKGTSTLWINNQDGRLTESDAKLGYSGAHALKAGDVDGDGNLDFVTVGCTPVAVYINNRETPVEADTPAANKSSSKDEE